MGSSEGGDDAYACPSFSSYSSDRIAEIAVKVAAESSRNNGDEDFEFALVRQDIAEENLLGDGQIFPVFNRNLLLNRDGEFSQSCESKELEASVVAVPLSKLLLEEDRELNNPPSCSSSEADELENIPAGTYCVWRPKPADQPSPSPSRCDKSMSTGSGSKRWKFRDLLRRSNSEGKGNFVFVTPKKTEEISSSEAPKKAKAKTVSSSASGGSPSAHEALYLRNRAMKEGDKRKSYLPYKQDILGIFVNINGLDRKQDSFDRSHW
ncbi:uncharacterized protein LOC127243954 [Andrographis paniculata]|uniref:uncharacterized protein LOC127243954 n=1 Tax=Andrographis paniculata TaxID=175694 RepID=UPI0021E90F8A|nr:uncharacterized protein LOC127243954 [Andrographis paniculata]